MGNTPRTRDRTRIHSRAQRMLLPAGQGYRAIAPSRMAPHGLDETQTDRPHGDCRRSSCPEE
jgi:hypothetical protein